MFRSILIANRGEIAVRIIRACRNMGIKSIAVYSKEDKDSLHVQLADRRVCIGEGPAKNSYLNMERIISAAKNTDADAIHPGFGFLSENADFVRLCKENGIAFIGPSAEVIDSMGNKSNARKTMMEAGVPVVPGTKEPVYDAATGEKLADEPTKPVRPPGRDCRTNPQRRSRLLTEHYRSGHCQSDTESSGGRIPAGYPPVDVA